MKPSNSKSQLVTNRLKETINKNDNTCPTTRPKSHNQPMNKNRNNKSKTIIQLK